MTGRVPNKRIQTDAANAVDSVRRTQMAALSRRR